MSPAPPDDGRWHDARVLVTGGGGFIGGHLVRALVARGADVTCLVCEHDPRATLWRSGDAGRVTLVNGRLEDFDALEQLVGRGDPVEIFHLGAQTVVGVARRDPLDTFESNIRGTYNLLEACRRAGGAVRSIVVASSDKAYGTCTDLPYTEATPLAGRFPYDVSKSCADLLAQCYAATWRLPLAIARCGNVFGPGDLEWSRIVPGTIRTLLAGERPVIRSDGTPLRDYLYVDDVVNAYLALAAFVRRGATDPARCAFNFGTGRPLTVLEMTRRLREAAGRLDLEPIVEDRAQCEIPAQHLDATRARVHLGWRADTSLDAALATTVAWYREALADAAPPPGAVPRAPPGGEGGIFETDAARPFCAGPAHTRR